MKKTLLILIGLLSLAAVAQAQIERAWIDLPDSICPFLTQQQRMDMFLAAKRGEPKPVVNSFDGVSLIDSINVKANYLSIRMTNNLHWEITTAAGMIRIEKVITAPIPSTTYVFYDFAWNFLRREREPFVPFPPDEEYVL